MKTKTKTLTVKFGRIPELEALKRKVQNEEIRRKAEEANKLEEDRLRRVRVAKRAEMERDRTDFRSKQQDYFRRVFGPAYKPAA